MPKLYFFLSSFGILAPLQDVRRQLYGDEDDRKFFQWVQSQLKQTETRLENGRAVLHHLQAQLINVACDDPGAAIGAQLALPLLQERLDNKAQDFARQKAAQAEEDIIKMEASFCSGCHVVVSCLGCMFAAWLHSNQMPTVIAGIGAHCMTFPCPRACIMPACFALLFQSSQSS